MTLKKKRLQYICKQAFDHLLCAVPQDSTQDNAECAPAVNSALLEINMCGADSVFVSPVDILQQG
jgi:hypothetical protein